MTYFIVSNQSNKSLIDNYEPCNIHAIKSKNKVLNREEFFLQYISIYNELHDGHNVFVYCDNDHNINMLFQIYHMLDMAGIYSILILDKDCEVADAAYSDQVIIMEE